jgi:nitrogenase molybdenum-iron protein NifN
LVPSKAEPSVGGLLATLGFEHAIPMVFGSTTATGFEPLDRVRALSEPTKPGDTFKPDRNARTADQISSHSMTDFSAAELITLLTVGEPVARQNGTDGLLQDFGRAFPQCAGVAVVTIDSSAATGSLEAAYASTVTDIITQLVPEAFEAGTRPGVRLRQLNVLASPMLTSGDLDHLRDIMEWFGLRPVFIPDVSASVSNYLAGGAFAPGVAAGTSVHELKTVGNAVGTLVVGPSLRGAADILASRTGVSTTALDHLYGLAATDALVSALQRISGAKSPDWLRRQRQQWKESLAANPFTPGSLRVGIAAEPDQMNGLAHYIREIGGEVVAAVSSGTTPALTTLLPTDRFRTGDPAQLESLAKKGRANILIGNSDAAQIADRLGLPIVRCGFPLHDIVGGHRKTFVGYSGAEQILFELTNRLGHPESPRRAVQTPPVGRGPQVKPTPATESATGPATAGPFTHRVPLPSPVSSIKQPMNLAFATDDVRQINQSFESASTFAVYAVEGNHAELVTAAEFAPPHTDNDGSALSTRIDRLKDCAAVYCEAVDAGAALQLRACGIQPIEVRRGTQISAVIDGVQDALGARSP